MEPTTTEVIKLIPPPATKKSRTVADRWTPELIRAGHIPIVRTFLRNYASLNPPLTSGEALFVIHLMDYKWDSDAPYPAYATIARNMGVSAKMTRRHAQSLETKGYLRREIRTAQPNRFHLQPLFKALEAHLEKQETAGPAKPRKTATA